MSDDFTNGWLKVLKKLSTLKSAIVVVVLIVIVTVSIFALGLFLYSTGGDSSVMSGYNFRIGISTESKLENLTFNLPIPVFMNESKIGEEAIIQNAGNADGWHLSLVETEYGKMLEITAKELVPELHQDIELEPPNGLDVLVGNVEDRPTGNVHSFTRGSKEVYVSMVADHIIDTRNAKDNEPILSTIFIYADYTTTPDANVEICITLDGTNEWVRSGWHSGWTYNTYSDTICTTLKGEQHGWIPASGNLVQGEGYYE